jgi:hypothetical protein
MIHRRSEVFPAPLGPTTDTKAPRGISKDTLFRISLPPIDKERFLISSAGTTLCDFSISNFQFSMELMIFAISSNRSTNLGPGTTT